MQPAKTLTPAEHTNALLQWKKLYETELSAVDQVILHLAQESDAPLIAQLTEYILTAGGKRLRPILTLLSAKLCGYTGKRHINLAAAIEFIHTATLLHDDVVDESDLRRGEETANHRWGNAASVLVGDFLLSRAFQLMAQDGSISVLQLLADASATISEGEVKQLMAQGNIETKTDTYIEIITAKTAQLFAAGCQIGPIVANTHPEHQDAMALYGLNLGIAFQIVDDVLDYSAKQEKLGKTIGDDFAEGKVTLPVILAYEASNDIEKSFWKQCIEEGKTEKDSLHRALSLMQHYKVLDTCMKNAQTYAQEARDALNIFPDSDEKTALLDLLDFAVNRPY